MRGGGNRAIWSVLGIAATRDKREIRRAYSAKLKTIDADNDPQAFIELREAYDHALWLIQIEDREHVEQAPIERPAPPEIVEAEPAGGLAAEPLADQGAEERPAGFADREDPFGPDGAWNADNGFGDDESFGGHDPFDDEDPFAASGPDPSDPADHEGERLFYDMADLLEAGDQDDPHRELDADQEAELERLAAAFWDWLGTRPVDDAARFEFGLARLIAVTVPRSDPLLEDAARFFGWEQRAENWDMPGEVAYVLNRLQGNRLMGDLMTPGHRLHNAWRELTEAPRGLRWAPRDDVRELLTLAEDRFPQIAAHFDPVRQERWEKKLGLRREGQSQGPRWIVWAIIGVVGLIRLVVAIGDSPNDRRPETVIANYDQYVTIEGLDRDAAIDDALRRLMGDATDHGALQARNPDLYQLFASNFLIGGNDGQSLEQYADTMRPVVNSRFGAALDKVGDDLVRENIRLRSEYLAYLRDNEPSLCITNERGLTMHDEKLPADFLTRRNDLIVRVLFDPIAQSYLRHESKAPSEFEFRTSVPRATFDAAMSGAGDPAVACTYYMDAYKAMLADPSEAATDFMRNA